MDNSENKELENIIASEEPESKVEMKASSIAKREKKKARREAKAARKAANKIEEKKTRPNNILLGIMIFGVLIGMFVFITAYNYFSKEASIETYIANNGGEEQYGSMAIDGFTTANITAKKNSMNIVLNIDTGKDKSAAKEYKKYYSGHSGEDQLKYIGSYFLGTIKPQTRGFSGDATVTAKLGDKEINSVKITYKEAKDIMENGLDHEDEEGEDASADETEDDSADEAEDDSSEE